MTSCSPGAIPPQVGEGGGVWIFAYGSLMWRPDFVHIEARPALLRGWHRAMCILSTHYRGTEANPGLVLGLDHGGCCRGRAFRVADEGWPAVRAVLHAREMITNVYRPRFLPVRLDDGRRVPAWSFITDRGHRQYWRGSEAEAAVLIRQGSGRMGSSRDYLAATILHLQELGMPDRALGRLLARVDAPG